MGPPRRDALLHARENGLLTDEESIVIPPAPQPTLDKFMDKGPVEDSLIEDEDMDSDPTFEGPKSTHRHWGVFHLTTPTTHTHVATSTVH